MTEREKLENIAEVALLRTGLVRIKRGTSDYDVIAVDKNNPEQIIGVEIKKTAYNKDAVFRAYTAIESKLRQLFSEKKVPIIVFFLDLEKESGYFSVIDDSIDKTVHSLKMDSFTRRVRECLKLYPQMEFPPYKFYQTEDEAKYETRAIPLDDRFRILRLHNISLTPIEQKNNLTLEIVIQQGSSKKKHRQALGALYYNPKLISYLFFIGETIDHLDLQLPEGSKYITFALSLQTDVSKFEATLNCEYLTDTAAKRFSRF